jgi:hypothetical protein
VNRPQTLGGRILLAGVMAGVFGCIDLENAGPQNAEAFESQVDVKTQSGQSSETVSVKGQVRDSGWFSIKFDGSMLDLNPMRVDALTAYGFNMLEPVQMEKSTLTETRVTLGVWDDWVRWTSRQAFSNYIKPGTDLGYLRQTGGRIDNTATSQRIETGIFKTDSIKLSVFADYARVGTYFAAPDFAIKRQDPFSKPNSATTRLGAIVEQGPIIFTLEQRSQQSLALDNAPIQVQNQIGVSLNFDHLQSLSSRISEGMAWVVPSSAWINVGEGRVRASLSQGVNGDTSDVSAGLSWMLGKIYANLGYWQSDYKSQLYPWKGSGINGSLGFHEGLWGIDIYFDVASSLQSNALLGMQQPTTTPTRDVTSGLLFYTRF